MFSIRRAGAGTGAPPFHAWRIISNSSAASQDIVSTLIGRPPRWDVRYSRYTFTASGAPL